MLALREEQRGLWKKKSEGSVKGCGRGKQACRQAGGRAGRQAGRRRREEAWANGPGSLKATRGGSAILLVSANLLRSSSSFVVQLEAAAAAAEVHRKAGRQRSLPVSLERKLRASGGAFRKLRSTLPTRPLNPAPCGGRNIWGLRCSLEGPAAGVKTLTLSPFF